MTNLAAIRSQPMLGVTARYDGAILSLFVLALCLTPGPASATDMADAICKVVQITQDEVGRGVASLAMVILGIAAMLGKASWTLALTVATGIVVLFGAQAIAGMVGAGAC